MPEADTGRLGIAACATGLASAALELATSYAASRRQFGRPVAEFQGTGFTLADMATAIEAGQDITKLAAMAKLFCTDTAMTVTASAVQILGAVGYTSRYPAERYMREAKVLQIFEGTNQIQRLIISRRLQSDYASKHHRRRLQPLLTRARHPTLPPCAAGSSGRSSPWGAKRADARIRHPPHPPKGMLAAMIRDTSQNAYAAGKSVTGL
jgi:hypothetical protein